MVKSIVSILSAAVLLASAAVFEWFFVADQFDGFRGELTALYIKVDEETANGEDAKAVRTAWELRKDKLHVWIPHNDISRVDDYMSEAVRLISERNYSLALPKLEILIHICETIPDTYRPALENIF